MKMFTTWRSLPENTLRGNAVQLVITYSSFNKEEIDNLTEMLKRTIAAGISGEYQVPLVKEVEE